MVLRSGWDLHSGRCGSSVQVVQFGGPAGRPGTYECLEHLKIDVPVFLECFRSLVSQPGVLREALNRWNPRPELAYIATEVKDSVRQLLSGHAWLILVNQSEGAGDEGVCIRIDFDFGRDTVPATPFVIGQTEPHEFSTARPRRCGPLSINEDSTPRHEVPPQMRYIESNVAVVKLVERASVVVAENVVRRRWDSDSPRPNASDRCCRSPRYSQRDPDAIGDGTSR